MKIRFKSILLVALTVIAGGLAGYFLLNLSYRFGYISRENIQFIRSLAIKLFGNTDFADPAVVCALFLLITFVVYVLVRAIQRKRHRDKGLNQTLPPL